jgi:IS605 OrfB family transposase
MERFPCIYFLGCEDALHQITTQLAKTKSAIVIEDLNVSGMLKNHRLAQAISDVGMFEFRRQLEYKGNWYGCEILLANLFYPSTKRCSRCGNVKSAIGLQERIYRCQKCDLVLDRDLNAAINLEQLLLAPINQLRRVPPEVTPVERAEDLSSRAALVEAGTEHQLIIST